MMMVKSYMQEPIEKRSIGTHMAVGKANTDNNFFGSAYESLTQKIQQGAVKFSSNAAAELATRMLNDALYAKNDDLHQE